MPLDMKYLEFCQDGSPFYVPSKSATVNPYKVDIPKEWSKHIHGPWTSLVSPNTELPIQGWKIHVTATLDNAQSILDTVCLYCFEHGLTFKYLSSSKALSDQNWKYANCSGSGKFITIYPVGDESFSQSLEGLDELLCEEKGPYILSDRRWKNGPLYYRYGSFLHRFDDAPGMSSLWTPTSISPALPCRGTASGRRRPTPRQRPRQRSGRNRCRRRWLVHPVVMTEMTALAVTVRR